MIRIFKLSSVLEDAETSGLGLIKGIVPDTIPELRHGFNWSVARLASSWVPPVVRLNTSPDNDYPCVNLVHPALSERAVEKLGPLLRQNGEILPLQSDVGKYYFYNLTTVCDVLDAARTRALWSSNGERALVVRRFEFIAEKLQLLSLFRIPQYPFAIFVTEPFMCDIKSKALNGFGFRLVWPLPAGVKWNSSANACC